MFEIIIYGYLYVFATISVLLFIFNLKRMILSFVIMILIFWIEFLTIYEAILEELGEGFAVLIMIVLPIFIAARLSVFIFPSKGKDSDVLG